MSLCEHCVQGVRHEGTPEGTIETINGVKAYVATPKGDYAKDKAIIYLADVFGSLELVNHQLQADDLALNGFKVYAPDLFEGDPVPADALTDAGGIPFDLASWFVTHGPDHTEVFARKVIDELKQQGVTAFGATGYCYGGRLVFNLAFDNTIKAAVVSHPSLLELGDIDKYAELSKAPLFINSCEVDPLFPKEKQERADALLGGGKFAPGYQRDYFDGCVHGFAVRGDLSNPKVKEGKERSFKNTVEWFKKYV